jgi:general secretion pathway protein C
MKKFVLKTGFLKAVTYCLFIGILVTVLFIVRSIFDLTETKRLELEGDGKAHSSQPRNESHGRLSYSQILRNNPFGFTVREKEVSVEEQRTAVKHDLVLVGTVRDRDGKGYAVLMDREGKQEIFKTGDRVFSLGELRRVLEQKVRIEGMRMYEIPLMDVSEVSKSKSQKKEARTLRPAKRTANSRFIKRTTEGEYVVDRRMVEDATKNPQQLMTDARLQPIFSGGNQNGFVLKEVRRGGLYYKLGLRNDDVLLRINQYDINNPESALHAFNALQGEDVITLNIVRKGSNRTLRYLVR